MYPSYPGLVPFPWQRFASLILVEGLGMKNLEERQREMRERTLASNTSDEAVIVPTPRKKSEQPSDANALKTRITELEKRVLTLEAENERLRAQKTIVVERSTQKSYKDSVREQQHNFFKYSNARRY
jgi:hypothetical protein